MGQDPSLRLRLTREWSANPPASGKVSAGLLMYRLHSGRMQFFLAHPGGPRTLKRHWTVPKGETDPGESLFDTALREFREEVGMKVAARVFLPLGWVRQPSGKVVHAWGFRGRWDNRCKPRSIHYEIEWPPGSSRVCSFPEVDRVGFFTASRARRLIKPAQRPFIDRLEILLSSDESASD